MRINHRQIIIYPLLFAIYPLLNLYITNIHLLKFSALVKPLILIMGVALILYLAANWLLKASTSAGILTTAIAVAILYYGAFYDLISNVRIIGSIVQRHEYLLPLWVILFGLVGALAVRKRIVSTQLNAYLNFLSAAIIGVVLVPGVVSLVHSATSDLSPEQTISNPGRSSLAQGRSLGARIELDSLPDVYYIILDGYGRADVLLDYFDFDNSAFINSLTSKGFYVASEGRSNYPHTFMSLASSLNMDYLDVSLTEGLSYSERIGAMLRWIEDNYVIQEFNNRGYTTINFASGWEGTNSNELADIDFKFSTINQFNSLFLNTTILRPIAPDYSQIEKRTIVLGTFDKLKDIAKIKGPTFAFAHVYVPHPPFIFDRKGNFPGYGEEELYFPWRPKEAYTDQVYFVNQLVEDLIDSILDQSENPPIIVIQGDHGPDSSWLRSRERLPILNAYYLPEGGEEYLYPTITPVNTFRLIFDLYFGTGFGLLEDKSFLSPYNAYFDLCEIAGIYPDDSDQDLWAARVMQSLAENAHRLRVNECAFEQILPMNDGFYGPELFDGKPFRWAGPSLKLQLPVEANQDYVFRAEVMHGLSNENQEVRLLIDGELVDSTTIPSGNHEITLIVPAERIHTEPFVRVRIEHSNSIPHSGRDPRELNLMYYWIEWAPLSEAETLLSANVEDIVVSGGIFLGGGWYPLETGRENFRWVNNDAEMIVIAPNDAPIISLEVAPGPGVSYQPFELQVLDQRGHVVATAEVKRREELVRIALPLEAGEMKWFRLHVEGGGQQAAPNDPRTLNFRVFFLGWSDDIQQYALPCSLTFSTGWHELEQSGQDWWRWTDGRGRVRVFVEQDTDAVISGELQSIQRPNKVDILVNGERLATLDITWDGFGAPAGSLPLHLKAGENIIEFVSHNPAITTATDSRSLAIAVKNLSLTIGADGGPRPVSCSIDGL
jgi:hypothetical protein